jgi:hypothetical protein
MMEHLLRHQQDVNFSNNNMPNTLAPFKKY